MPEKEFSITIRNDDGTNTRIVGIKKFVDLVCAEKDFWTGVIDFCHFLAENRQTDELEKMVNDGDKELQAAAKSFQDGSITGDLLNDLAAKQGAQLIMFAYASFLRGSL